MLRVSGPPGIDDCLMDLGFGGVRHPATRVTTMMRSTPRRYDARTSVRNTSSVTHTQASARIFASPGTRPSMPRGSIRESIQVSTPRPLRSRPAGGAVARRIVRVRGQDVGEGGTVGGRIVGWHARQFMCSELARDRGVLELVELGPAVEQVDDALDRRRATSRRPRGGHQPHERRPGRRR